MMMMMTMTRMMYIHYDGKIPGAINFSISRVLSVGMADINSTDDDIDLTFTLLILSGLIKETFLLALIIILKGLFTKV